MILEHFVASNYWTIIKTIVTIKDRILELNIHILALETCLNLERRQEYSGKNKNVEKII